MRQMTLDIADVARFAAEFDQLFARCDSAAMAAYFADDAQILAPDTELVQGREAIAGFWQAASEAAHAAAMKRTVAVRHSEAVGNLGYVMSTATLEIPSGSETVTRRFNHLTVWRVGADGVWRIVADAASTAPAVPAHLA